MEPTAAWLQLEIYENSHSFWDVPIDTHGL